VAYEESPKDPHTLIHLGLHRSHEWLKVLNGLGFVMLLVQNLKPARPVSTTTEVMNENCKFSIGAKPGK
jgi:hypothetical protein